MNTGKIYKIEPINNGDDGDIYIGSTKEKYLSRRFNHHKDSYEYWKNGKYNKVMVYDLFDKYGIENCEIILLENVNYNTKDELHAREKYYIKSLKCVNKYIPTRTHKEYYQDNKEELLNTMKENYSKNKAKILKQHSQIISCKICGYNYTYGHQARHFKSLRHIKAKIGDVMMNNV